MSPSSTIWLYNTTINEQTYQSPVIWLRIMNRQIAHIQTMTITVAGEVLHRNVKGSVQEIPRTCTDKYPTKCGQSQIHVQPPFQDLAPDW